jgi:arsenite methyltransferase
VRADYGIDAPGVIRALALLGATATLLAARFAALGMTAAAVPWAVCGAALLGTVLLMLRSSRRGKLAERDRLLDGLRLSGEERVLDVGCGRGLLLIGAARRLRSGRAVGIDLWSARDQSANSRAATLANAELESVADRVEVLDGDMRTLPFADASFDCAIACLAIHNVAGAEDRAAACREIARVLRPGGRVAVLDFSSTREYVRAFERYGLDEVARSGLRWRMYPPVRLVTARKPG